MLEQVLKVKNIFFTLAFLSDVRTKMTLQNFVAKKKGKEQNDKNDKKQNGKKEKHIQRKYGQ